MNLFKRISVSLALLTAVVTMNAASDYGFAIFVDSISFTKTEPELKAYAAAVDRQGLKSEIVVVTEDVTPDSLRSIIRTMATRKASPIEGMVFVGDIPIPMLLDAQHLTSAFKVSQNPKRLERSSCPSDRFYDDLNLKFDFIARDQKKPLLYYYSMTAESPQKVMPSLYSGRIKSMDFYGKDKYDNLRDYLRKIVRLKSRDEQLTQMLYFSGSGYNSESVISRIDEKAAHLEHFPWMKNRKSTLTYIDHKDATFTKYMLMSQMQRPDLSLALLHHHGSPTKEYINRYPDTRNAREQLEGAKSYFRSKIRGAVENGVPFDSACASYARNFDVPVEWFKDVMTPASIAADSIYDYQLDLHIGDFGKYKPNARVVILDACFNGAFNNDKYIAGAYIFGEGDCAAVIANSVNSLQDKLCDRNLGMLGLGMRVGNIVKYNPYLESHVLGDPTFAFASNDKKMFDVNRKLHEGPSFWKKQLKSEYPVVQALALEKLAADGAITPAQLLEQYKTSPNYLTRLSAFMLLSESGAPEFTEAIALGLDDSYELIRRFASVFAGKNGNPELIPTIINVFARQVNDKRVNFQLQNAMTLFSYDSLIKELEKQRPYRNAYNEADLMEKARKSIAERFSDKKFEESLAMLTAEKPDMKEIKSFVRQMRNYPLHPSFDKLVDYLYACNDDNVQKSLVEAFGWFNYSYIAPKVAERMDAVASDSRFSDSVRNEARKSAARLRH